MDQETQHENQKKRGQKTDEGKKALLKSLAEMRSGDEQHVPPAAEPLPTAPLPNVESGIREDMIRLQSTTAAAAIEREDKKKKKMLLFLLIFVLALLILLLLHQVGYIKFPWEQTALVEKEEMIPVVAGDLFPGAGDATSGMLSNMSKEDILEQMQIAADANYFSFKINTLLVFDEETGEADVGIENPSYNVYPMVVQINLGEDGQGEMIYDSGGILPDYHIDRAKLSKELPQGTYKALAHLYAYDPDTQVNVFKSTAELTIVVNS